MANFFGKTLLSLVAACVAQGVTLAQDAQEHFMDAVRLIRINKPEEGLQKLREAVELDPSNAEAFELWTQANETHGVFVWQMLLDQGGEYEQLAKQLIDRATLGRATMSRDEAAIAELIGRAQSDDFKIRNGANRELASNYGEFAVPQLLRILGDSDAGRSQDLAMLTLLDIGRAAVLPLIEALKSDNELMRRGAVSVLVRIGDKRAAAPMARLVDDPSLGVRDAVRDGLRKLGVPAGADPAALLVRDARSYLETTDAEPSSEVVWTWSPTAKDVIPHDVPAPLYSLELAKMRAQDAMQIDPANQAASTLLADAYLAQATRIGSDPELSGVAEAQGRLHMAAMVLGRDTLRAATIAAANREDSAAVEAMATDLGIVEGGEISGTPLIDLLDSQNTPIRYAAALSMAKQANGPDLPASGNVVRVLGEAITEEALRAVLVIDADPMTLSAARELGERRGYAVREATSGKAGVAAFYTFPSFDLVLLSENVDGVEAATVASLIKKRNPETKVVLLARSEDAESNFEGKVDDFLMPEGDLTADAIAEKTEELVESLEDRRARADKYARAAGDALARVAGSRIDISPVAAQIAAQLDRDDSVAIPATRALAVGGAIEQTGALAELLNKDGASDELRQAAADAIGEILSRSSAIPTGVLSALIAVASDSDADILVRQAAANALGRGRLDAGTRLKLVEILRAIPEGSGD